MRLTILFALLLVGCDGDSRAAEPASASAGGGPSIPSDAPVVAVLGDSLAAGLHLPRDAAYPHVLQRALAEDGAPFRLVNAGVSGDTTAGGLSRVDWLLRQDPDLLLVELGGNDGLRGLPLAMIEENLRGIVARAREAGVPVVLAAMRLPPNYGSPYADGFEALFHRVGSEPGVVLAEGFLDGVGGVRSMNLADGIHPTEQGHRRLAQNLAPVVRRALAALAL